MLSKISYKEHHCQDQGGITCEAVDEPRKSSKAINKHVIINFHDKNVLIALFCDKNEVFVLFIDINIYINIYFIYFCVYIHFYVYLAIFFCR